MGCNVVVIWLGKIDWLLIGMGCLVCMVVFYVKGWMKVGDWYCVFLLIGF